MGSAALIIGTSAVERQSYGYRTAGQYGTTGHYGNQYGHGGNELHDHHDHIYGYDSVPKEKLLLTTLQARNETTRQAVVT